MSWLSLSRSAAAPSRRRRGRIASAVGAFGPNLFEPDRNALNPLPHKARVTVAEEFGADIDDATGVDHIVRRVKNPALVQSLSVLRRRKLVIRAARDDRRLQGRNAFLRQ